MKKKFILLSSLTVLLLSGCWDISEPQRMYYVHGVGIDYKDGQFEVYIQIINFATVAKSEVPNPQAVQSEVGRAKGRTMEEAFFKLYRSIDQKLFWGHLTYVLFSEEALKSDNAISVIDSLLRYRETRYQIWVYCTQNPIDEVLLITPILNKTLTASKLSNPLNTEEQETFVEPVNLRNLVIGLNEPGHEIGIPYVNIDKNWESTEAPASDTALMGVGVLSKDGFKGFLKDKDARGMQWMTNKTKRGELTFNLDGDDNYLTVTAKKIKIDIKPVVKSDQVTFDIDVKLEATVNGFKTKATEKEIRKKIEKDVKKEIRETYKAALEKDIDIYRLSEHLYRKNVKDWKRLQKGGKVELTTDSISKLDVQVRVNSGRKTFAETINE